MEERINRRRFVSGAVAASLLQSTGARILSAQKSATHATVAVDTKAQRVPLPAGYTGLSYESAQLANPGYFSAENTQLVQLVRQLGAKGVLRIGGSTTDYGRWSAVRAQRNASWNEPANPDSGQSETAHVVITETAIDELRGFLEATGWTAIYSLNLGSGSPEAAADEAEYVVNKLDSALVALQIGNEPDLFSRDLRKPAYPFAQYFHEWQGFASAIRRRLPNAPLAGPDISSDIDWVEQFSQQATGIQMLTSHYYAEGPPESPDSDIKHLLMPDPQLEAQIGKQVGWAKAAHIPYRMSEGNSCYNGGKAGVSDAFASALWGADYMLLLAGLGVAGVNFHGGGQGFYTPIAGGGKIPFQVRPLYYGMMFFREFASGSLIPCALNAGNANATAYACLNSSGRLALTIFNKDLEQDLDIELQGELLRRPSRTLALEAPGVTSKTGIRLGGRSISTSPWTPVYSQRAGRRFIHVPKTSALLLVFEGVAA